MEMLQYYLKHSPFTDPGAFAARLGTVPSDLRSLHAAARRLVFHYRADGDWQENGIAPERIAEIDTRYAEPMLERLVALRDAPLTDDRAPNERLVGCCRDFTVLFLALARHHGIPARARVGFAAYFIPGWFIDHEIAEVWDAAEGRWRLLDPELGDTHTDPNDGAMLEPRDLAPDRFIVGAQAWRDCRAGRADPERFVVHPELHIPGTRGWQYLKHNLIHDLAALNSREMILWEEWGLEEVEEPTEAQLEVLDRAAQTMARADASLDDLRALYERDEFRVPAVVTSYTAASETPQQVTLRPLD